MYQKIKPLFLICETPLHAGSGSDLGIVDLPIQRERHTSFPKIEASSLKGALREALESKILIGLKKEGDNYSNKEDIKPKVKELNRVFGHDDGALRGFSKEEMQNLFDEKNRDFAGCIGFTDARLLLFPVKSLYGVFAWITCPRVIKKFISDLELNNDLPFDFDKNKGVSTERVPSSSLTLFDSDNRVTLEEFIFDKIEPEDKGSNLDNIATWLSEKVFAKHGDYWKEKVKTDIVVLEDTDFRDFVNLSTEVITRTKISNVTGTVDKENGALFTEEYLPSESVLYSMVMYSDEFKKDGLKVERVQSFFQKGLDDNKNVVQVGGNATLGKGIIKTVLINQM